MSTSLQELINVRKEESFIPGYEASDEEACGLVIAHHFEWDGLAILKTAMWALEDANFHTESGLIEKMIQQYESDSVVLGLQQIAEETS